MATALDPDMILELCKRLGGYGPTFRHLAEKGIKNPDTGRPFSKHAIKYFATKAKGHKEYLAARGRRNEALTKAFEKVANEALKPKE